MSVSGTPKNKDIKDSQPSSRPKSLSARLGRLFTVFKGDNPKRDTASTTLLGPYNSSSEDNEKCCASCKCIIM